MKSFTFGTHGPASGLGIPKPPCTPEPPRMPAPPKPADPGCGTGPDPRKILKKKPRKR